MIKNVKQMYLWRPKNTRCSLLKHVDNQFVKAFLVSTFGFFCSARFAHQKGLKSGQKGGSSEKIKPVNHSFTGF